ncbi:hypothetical protein [Dyella sp. 2RAB6]|uniref:hypothetical protein n=1 Tax=Dyella sp. 2RAB6 TaxID=3232992 RepID=UPI003F921A5D
MHLELPKTRLHSLKDFAKHYLMIVLSILTALGLEAWIEHAHHKQAAAEASARIDAEIQQNLAEIQRISEHDQARAKDLAHFRDVLAADIKAHASDETIRQHAHANAPEGLYLDYRWPVLRREAWDLAVANQSASWIDNDRLRAYSSIYATQAASLSNLAADIPLVLNGPRAMDMGLDFDNDDYQPRELLHVANQMAGTVHEVVNMLDGLHKRIEAALPADKQHRHS